MAIKAVSGVNVYSQHHAVIHSSVTHAEGPFKDSHGLSYHPEGITHHLDPVEHSGETILRFSLFGLQPRPGHRRTIGGVNNCSHLCGPAQRRNHPTKT